jgi:pyruvate formate lyase activating enzyme
MAEIQLKVGGLTPMTTLDFPGRLASVIFCQGCPLRCRYCHNPELLPRQSSNLIPWSEILDFLRARRGLIDAVVFSGGEPTQQRTLPQAIAEVRALGYQIGLHTAGVYPKRLEQLLPQLDWVGLDIKALPEGYPALTGMPASGRLAWRSAELLIKSAIPHELRTTFHPALMKPREKHALVSQVAALNPRHHRWQTCRTQNCLDTVLSRAHPSAEGAVPTPSIHRPATTPKRISYR